MKTAIEMAEEAGFERLFEDAGDWVCFTDEIERFAELVRADERNNCSGLDFRMKVGLTSEQDYKISELILNHD